MGRRKGVPNKAARCVKGKGPKKESKANDVDRNRASLIPVIKICKTSQTEDQRDAVDKMGQGGFLDIKCEDLHNPLVCRFARCYDLSRRAFAVPCRGVIPLSKESVELMTGLPRGLLEVNYAENFELEEQISNRLFPGQGSRPSASDVAKRISQYEHADDTFKELWMIHTVSTVVAPTLDNKISNKGYSILPDIGRSQEMNMCKFVADQLHESFSNGKFGKDCLLYCMVTNQLQWCTIPVIRGKYQDVLLQIKP